MRSGPTTALLSFCFSASAGCGHTRPTEITHCTAAVSAHPGRPVLPSPLLAAIALYCHWLRFTMVKLYCLCFLSCQVTKSSIMLGCGETREEVVAALQALRGVGVDVVTLGQYMRPTKKHMAVSEYVTPAAFAAYQQV